MDSRLEPNTGTRKGAAAAGSHRGTIARCWHVSLPSQDGESQFSTQVLAVVLVQIALGRALLRLLKPLLKG